MQQSFGIFTILVTLAAAAGAQEPAERVRTGGTGELRRAADVMVSPGNPDMPTLLPATVRMGEVISIRYQTSGNTFADSFLVTGITISGDRCSIESKHNNADGNELIDVIFTRPCSRLK
jgi:hypothetical protein